MSAKSKRTQLELYAMDLVWLIAKLHYENLPQPSETYNGRKDGRTTKQIKDDLLRKLGGE